MRAQIIVVGSCKGGVGKTTVTYGLVAAAVSLGNRVIALDTDPSGGLSVALSRRAAMVGANGTGGGRPPTAYDVLEGGVPLADALYDHPLGIIPGGRALLRTVAADARLNKAPIRIAQLQTMLEPVLEEADFVIIDTQPFLPALIGPFGFADHIVIPTMLDMPSLQSTTLTIVLLERMQLLNRVRGLAITNMRRPAARIAESFYRGLAYSGLPFETILYNSEAWVRATSGSGHLPDALVLAEAQKLFQEVLVRQPPMDGFKKLLALARGSGAASSS